MGWETGNGEKKELSLIANNTSEFPILRHTATCSGQESGHKE